MQIEMKDSGVKWIGKIPCNWSVVPTKRFFSNHKNIVGSNVDNYDRLALTLKGVIRRNKDDNEGLQPEKFEGYQILNRNELVFKLIDLENIKTSRVGLSNFTGIVSPAYIVLTNKEKDNRFYYYWFINLYYQEVFNNLGGDGVRSALNAKDLLSLPIVKVDNNVKKNIANLLDSKCSKIDSIIDKQQAVIEKLKLYKSSLITECVTKGLNPNVEMKDSGVEWIGKIPKHWLCPKISYIASTASGATPSRNYKEYWNGTVKWIKTGELQNKEIYDSEEKITEKGLLESSAKLFKENTILIAMYGQGKTRGMTGLLKINSSTNQACAGITVTSDKINFNFLWKFLIGAYDGLRQLAVGSGQPNLNLNLINNFKVTLPSIEEQIDIVNYLNFKGSAIDSSIEKKQKIIEKLQQYKKSLIYEVVTGKKAV